MKTKNSHHSLWLIHSTDISFPRTCEGSYKPLKTLWRSTMGVQSPSTLPTDAWTVCIEGVARRVLGQTLSRGFARCERYE